MDEDYQEFDPIALLELLDPSEHEDVCQSAARAIIAAASGDFENDNITTTSEVTLSELSHPEIRAYKEQLLKAMPITAANTDDETSELTAATVIYLRTMCDMIMESKSLSEYKRSTRLAEIGPDVTVLGDVIGKHVGILNNIRMEIETLDEDDEEMMAAYDHREDNEVFICLHLLKLAKVVNLNEEGTRRHFSSILHRILCNPGTHEDLVEGAIHALSASHDNEPAFLLSVSEVLASIIDTEDEEGEDGDGDESENDLSREDQYLRGIEILSVALEKTSRKMSSNAILQNFSSTILTAITNSSLGPFVREAGVSCLGRYVILMDEEAIIQTFKSLLMGIAFGKDEKIEIRAQAMLAICDLAFMFHRIMAPIVRTNVSDDEVTVSDLLLQMLSQPKISLAIVV